MIGNCTNLAQIYGVNVAVSFSPGWAAGRVLLKNP
jgi:hypothetical protein